MSPWVPQLPARIRKQYCKTGEPNSRGLSFYQALGFRRKARAAAETEFSRILNEASDDAKRLRHVPPWDTARKIEDRLPSRIPLKEGVHFASMEDEALELEQQKAVEKKDSDKAVKSRSPSPAPLYQSGYSCWTEVPQWSEETDEQHRDLLDELNMPSLEKLWVAIKAKSMVTQAQPTITRSSVAVSTLSAQQNKANVEKIGLRDFLNLGGQFLGADGAMKGLLEEIFRLIDQRSNGGTACSGTVRTHDVITALVLISRYDQETKLRTLFHIFDADDDGCVALDDMLDLFISVKANDLARHGTEAQADAIFNRELSLQAAKRLFELTVPHLSIDSATSLLVFDDFHKAVLACPVVKQNLLPGFFSLAWLKGSFEAARQIRSRGEGRRKSAHKKASVGFKPSAQLSAQARDIKKSFIATLRRGEENLDLSTRLGRGERILRHVVDGVDDESSREQAPIVRRQSIKIVPCTQRGPVHTSVKHAENSVVAPPKSARPPSGPPLRARIQAAAAKAVKNRSSLVDGIFQDVTEKQNKSAKSNDPKGSKAAGSDTETRNCDTVVIGDLPSPTSFSQTQDVEGTEGDGENRTPLELDWLTDQGMLSAEQPPPPSPHQRRVHIDYDMREAATAVELPHGSKELRLSGENSKRFRQAMMDEQTEQQYRLDCERDAMKGNKKYACMICGMSHHLNKRRRDPHEKRALCHSCHR